MPCLGLSAACGELRGCWFISCWALNWCILWNIALSFLGIGVRPLCSVTSHCHLQTAEWLHAQVSAASAWDHNCSIPCLGLVHWLAFQPSHWSINHAPNYMCTDICCMPGFSLASQWLLWLVRVLYWSVLIGWAAHSAFSFLPVISGQEVRTGVERLRDIWW